MPGPGTYGPGEYPLGSGSVDETPYEAVPGAPAGTSLAAKGRKVLQLGNVWADRPNTFESIATWSSPQPQPVALHLQVDSRSGYSFNAPFAGAAEHFAGSSGAAMSVEAELHDLVNGTRGGAFRITYGVQSQWRTIEADLRAGSFQLPPCDFVDVSAFLYLQGPLSVDVGAIITAGILPRAATFTNTLRVRVTEENDVRQDNVPPQARWVAMWGGQPTGIAAGQPVLTFTQQHGLRMVHDFATGLFMTTPGTPQELPSREAFSVKCVATAYPQYITTRFYLEV